MSQIFDVDENYSNKNNTKPCYLISYVLIEMMNGAGKGERVCFGL